MTDKRCPNCGSDRPGQHYQDACPGDATLRPLADPEARCPLCHHPLVPRVHPVLAHCLRCLWMEPS